MNKIPLRVRDLLGKIYPMYECFCLCMIARGNKTINLTLHLHNFLSSLFFLLSHLNTVPFLQRLMWIMSVRRMYPVAILIFSLLPVPKSKMVAILKTWFFIFFLKFYRYELADTSWVWQGATANQVLLFSGRYEVQQCRILNTVILNNVAQ